MCTHANTCDTSVVCSGLQLLPPHGPPRICLCDICSTIGFWGGCPPARRTLNQLARYAIITHQPLPCWTLPPRQLSMFAGHTWDKSAKGHWRAQVTEAWKESHLHMPSWGWVSMATEPAVIPQSCHCVLHRLWVSCGARMSTPSQEQSMHEFSTHS